MLDSPTRNPIIDDYFNRWPIRKLHIGCEGNLLHGWLNSDYDPYSEQILYLDATKPFPFNDSELDYIYSEHMIEHITYPEGLKMLGECHRVLKPNGKIRISTPDFAFLIALYKENKSELQNQYIRWATESFIEGAPYYDDIFVINNFVRDWGHTFVYDEKTLRFSLQRAGFSEVIRCDLNASDDEALRGLENEGRLPPGFLKLESLILEATKRY